MKEYVVVSEFPWSYAQLITNTTTAEANPLVYVV
jgi:hypothetical protein